MYVAGRSKSLPQPFSAPGCWGRKHPREKPKATTTSLARTKYYTYIDSTALEFRGRKTNIPETLSQRTALAG